MGAYQNRKLYVLLFGGEPKHHQIKGLEQDGKNNVFGFCSKNSLIQIENKLFLRLSKNKTNDL
ncbi:hypothetical protein VCR17J2_90138 [Vibrio coralliirubri]|nr:hypothetical protein VCR17J2_90138 [Vibrio coralliirubri]